MHHASYDNDGYISDVQISTTAPSEVSRDLVESTKVLEKHFKDKYNVLREAYEQRIKQVSSMVEDTCSKLFSDELLLEMKNDKTSAAFIPAHLSETIGNHLQGEAERHVHLLLQKLSAAELMQNQSTTTIATLVRKLEGFRSDLNESKANESAMAPLAQKLHSLEGNYRLYSEQCERELDNMRNEKQRLELRDQQIVSKLEMAAAEIAEKGKMVDKLRAQLDAKGRDVDALEMSFEQSARELSMIEGMERQV
jgi:hypothetical protein